MVKLLKYLEENILSLGIIALLLFIPLYPKFPLFNVEKTYVAIRIEDFLVAAIFLVWLILEIKQGWPTFKEATARYILLYFLAGMISLLSALLITRVVIPHLALLHYLRRIEYMSLFFVAFASVKRKRFVKSFLYTTFLASIGVFIYGIGQKYFNWPVISTMNEEFSKGIVLYLSEWTRINSTFAGHYDLATYAVLTLALCLGFIVQAKGKLSKLFGFFFFSILFYLLLLTASRISFFAYLIMLMSVLFWSGKKKWIISFVGLSLMVMVLSSELGQRYAATFKIDLSFLSEKISLKRKKIGLVVSTLTPTPAPIIALGPSGTLPAGLVKEQPEKTEVGKQATLSAQGFPAPETIEMATQRSGEIRFKVEWPRALRAFIKNPLFGTGYSSVSLATDNDYLRVLAETGILGFAALTLIFLEMGKKFIFFIKRRGSGFEKSIAIGIGGAIVGFLANAFFIDVFEASKVAFLFWIFSGFLIGIINKNPK